MNGIRLVLHQWRYDQKTFWREPTAVFFTVGLPIIFLFLFVSIFGNDPVDLGTETVKGSTYYVPGLVTLAIVSATTVNLAISVAMARERGLLKRLRATPMPPWVYMAGRVVTATIVSLFMTVLVTLLGAVVYGVEVPTSTIPALILTVIVGTAALCCLGFALTAAIPSENAAPAVANAVVLPLYFISGIFVPTDQIPKAMQTVASIFPVKHLFEALLTIYNPATTGSGLRPADLAVLAVWGVVGLLVAAKTFRWSPR
ncbi:MAG: type transport system permease protein [Actinomycetota bacterium]|nr:type transport system permease protein [Actinomycetota bacterium]MEA2844476.1 type transport system permease protein [Actinomycetota bacterium]